MKIKLFYSWQSDTSPKTNKDFIEEAVQSALGRLNTSDDIELDVAFDRDTLGIPGSPEIARSILEKIDQCSLFLGDVTIISKTESGKPTPNPNVLIELGYAAGRKSWEQIICIMNQEYGGPTKLPFDLRHRRWPILYRLSNTSSSEKLSEEKQRLSENIELAIRAVVENGILHKTINSKDQRVARRFEIILRHSSLTLSAFLRSGGLEDGMQIFQKDYHDLPGTNYPSPELMEPLISVFANNSLNKPSNVGIKGNKLSWVQAFAQDFTQVAQTSDKLLDQYADRDDALVSMVEEIRSRAHTLAFMLNTRLTAPELAHLYINNTPKQDLDFLRYYYLTMLKSYRIIREFSTEEIT